MESFDLREVKASVNNQYDLVAWRWLLRCERRSRYRRNTCLDCYGRARDLLRAGGMWAVPDCIIGVDVVLADQQTGVLEVVEARTQVAILSFVHAVYQRGRVHDERAAWVQYNPDQLAVGVPFVRAGASHVARVADLRARWGLYSAVDGAAWEPQP